MFTRTWLARLRLAAALFACAAVSALPVACAALGGSQGQAECHKGRGTPECR